MEAGATRPCTYIMHVDHARTMRDAGLVFDTARMVCLPHDEYAGATPLARYVQYLARHPRAAHIPVAKMVATEGEVLTRAALEALHAQMTPAEQQKQQGLFDALS